MRSIVMIILFLVFCIGPPTIFATGGNMVVSTDEGSRYHNSDVDDDRWHRDSVIIRAFNIKRPYDFDVIVKDSEYEIKKLKFLQKIRQEMAVKEELLRLESLTNLYAWQLPIASLYCCFLIFYKILSCR